MRLVLLRIQFSGGDLTRRSSARLTAETDLDLAYLWDVSRVHLFGSLKTLKFQVG